MAKSMAAYENSAADKKADAKAVKAMKGGAATKKVSHTHQHAHGGSVHSHPHVHPPHNTHAHAPAGKGKK